MIEFLTTNPHEALSASDIEAKFDRPRKAVHTTLAPAIAAGALTRTEDMKDGELIYKLGTGHPLVTAKPAKHSTLVVASKAAVASGSVARTVRRAALVLNVDEVARSIRRGVPLPPARGARRSTDWPALFERMAPGESVLVPEVVRSGLIKAITAYTGAHPGAELATRRCSDAQIRIWRIA